MNSRELKTIDELVSQALQAQVKDAQPPQRVWRRIRRKAMTWGTRHLPDMSHDWRATLATLIHIDSFFLPNADIYHDVAAAKVLDLRFATHAGSFFRFV